MVQQNRQNSTGSAIAILLLSAVGGLGLLVILRPGAGDFSFTAVARYLIWDEVPDRWAVLGATIIIASGLFVVFREIGSAISGKYLRAITASSAAALRRRLTRQTD